MAKTAGVFHQVVGSSFKLIGASVAIKRGSTRQIVVLPSNHSSSAVTKLMTLISALDQLTAGSIRSASTNLFKNSISQPIPADSSGRKSGSFSATVWKTDGGDMAAGGMLEPGFSNNLFQQIKEAEASDTSFPTGDILLKNMRNYVDYVLGSYYGPDNSYVTSHSYSSYSPTDNYGNPPLISTAGLNQNFNPSTIFDAAVEALDPFPEWYIKTRIGDSTFFYNYPRLEWGGGAGDIDLLTLSAAAVPTVAPASNMQAILNIAKILSQMTLAQVTHIGFNIVTNSNSAVPPDNVGREAVKSVDFRVTNAADRTMKKTFKLTIPFYDNIAGITDLAIQTLIETDIGGYFKGVFSSAGNDEVEVLF